MKNILYITYDGLTDPLGQSQILPYLVGLSKQGFRFTILSFEKEKRFAVGEKAIQDIISAANINWVHLPFSTKPPILSKVYDVWQMKNKAIELQRKIGFDLVHCRSYVAAQAGLRLKEKFGIPFLFDMRGFWADEKKEAGRWPVFLYRHYKKLEQRLLRHSDAVVSLTHAAKNEMSTWPIDHLTDKISVIPCCADLELFNFLDNENAVNINEEAKGHFPIINYLGSLGPAYGIKEMLQFFNLVKEKFSTARFFFYTKDDSSLILNHLEEYKNISQKDLLFRFVPRKELPGYLSVVDYSLFFYQPAYSRLACSPTKFAELAGMGIPVICNSVGDLNKDFLAYTPHKVIDDLSEQSMKKAVEEIKPAKVDDKKKIRAFALDNYSLESGVAGYGAIYNKLIR